MKKTISGRIVAALLSSAILGGAVLPGAAEAANVQDNGGLTLQTIKVDNDGKDWVTESWGGQNVLPNLNWTNLTLRDYYYNGQVSYEVRKQGDGETTYRIGMTSRRHGQTSRVYWNDMPEYKTMKADSQWREVTLPIKDLVDAFPESGFSIDNFWYIAVSAVPSGNTLEFRNVEISSPDDERQYPFIKVDQVGYETGSRKRARVSYFEKFGSLTGKKFQIVDAETGDVAFEGEIPAPESSDPFSGENVHILDFDEVKAPGTYLIRIPEAGLDPSARSPRDVDEGLATDEIVSFRFKIGRDVYDDLMKGLAKYYYYQRQGIDLEEKYAGDFAREDLHPGDSAVRRWSDRDNDSAETYDISGGWYDAGDYGKYITPAATSVEDLLLAYELFPESFSGIDQQIPESDPENERYVDAPPILSEVKWELDMMMKMEHSSKDGSFVPAANYSDGVIYMEDTLYKTSTSQSAKEEYDLRSHLATASAAGVFAHAYAVYRDVPAYADFADECLALAERSWSWINDPSNAMQMSIGAANRTYTFTQKELDREMFWAAATLYRAEKLSGSDPSAYEDYLIANCENENVVNCFTGASLSYNHGGRSFLGFFHYLWNNPDADPAITKTFERFKTWRTRYLANDIWGTCMPDWGYWWGSNGNVARNALTLMMGSFITDGREDIPDEVRLALESAFNYLLGENPVSFSYVSGFGENSVSNIYSGIYSNLARLDPYRCPDGYFTEGADDRDAPHLSKFSGKCYIDSDAEYTTNENTIYGNAAMLLLTSAIKSYNDSRVRGDINADGKFNIADAVLLQSWLLKRPGSEPADWKAGDLSSNGMLDTFDLIAMKEELVE